MEAPQTQMKKHRGESIVLIFEKMHFLELCRQKTESNYINLLVRNYISNN